MSTTNVTTMLNPEALSSLMAQGLAENQAKAVEIVACTYCGKPMTFTEISMLQEALGEADLTKEDTMCDACANATDPEAAAPDAAAKAAEAAEIAKLKEENEILKLRAENAKLKAAAAKNAPKPIKTIDVTTAPATTSAPNTATQTPPPVVESARAAEVRLVRAKLKAALLAAAPYKPTAAGDAKLLEILRLYPGKPRTDGKAVGTLAVKVHAHLHALGISQVLSCQITESAIQRNVISQMSIPTANGRMMLYFDAKIRPNTDNRVVMGAAEIAAGRAAFGLIG